MIPVLKCNAITMFILTAPCVFAAARCKNVIYVTIKPDNQERFSVIQFTILYKDKISMRKKMNERHG